MPPRPDPVTVVELRRQLATTPAPALPANLHAHMDPQPRPIPRHDLDRHDHNLAPEPQDRSKYLTDAHAVPPTLTDLDSQATYGTDGARTWTTPGTVS